MVTGLPDYWKTVSNVERMTIYDNFDGTSLDTSKWEVSTSTSGYGSASYSVGNGVCTLLVRLSAGGDASGSATITLTSKQKIPRMIVTTFCRRWNNGSPNMSSYNWFAYRVYISHNGSDWVKAYEDTSNGGTGSGSKGPTTIELKAPEYYIRFYLGESVSKARNGCAMQWVDINYVGSKVFYI